MTGSTHTAVEATIFDATFTIVIDALRTTSVGKLNNVIKQVDWTLTGAQDGQTFALPQTTTLPDKGVWHRVRVGPYTAIEDLNRARETLKQNNVEITLIKVREAPVQPGK